MVSALAYWWEYDEIYAPLTAADLSMVKVFKGKPDGFGCEVEVSAPPEVWEKAKEALEKISE